MVRPYQSGIRHDYKDSSPSSSRFDPRSLSWFAGGLLLPLAVVMLFMVGGERESDAAAASTDAHIPVKQNSSLASLTLLPANGERVAIALPVLTRPAAEQPRPETLQQNAMLSQGEALTLTVQRNDSMDRLFRRNDLSPSDLAAMVDLPDAGRHLTRINPGDKIEIIRNGRDVLSLRKELSESQELWIRRDEGAFKADLIDLAVEIRTAGAHGTISSSLWNAATDAGLTFGVIEDIAGIFEWDIDFQLEVREGDSFTVVYEEIWRDGVKLRDGQIIAAEFVNRGESYRAARYIDATGDANYFTPEGMSVKRPFLRNPIEFSRVSSNFNPSRRHPILNTIRAHRGVDLAAASGTPIRAAGDGKIVARGANGSFGNRIEIQHGGNITTLYAHMSRFADFRVGDRVKQGDIIGYVGMTGGATGPHLHYEYRVNGVHQNPRTVELPDAEPINSQYLTDFEKQSQTLWHQLDLQSGPRLAASSN